MAIDTCPVCDGKKSDRSDIGYSHKAGCERTSAYHLRGRFVHCNSCGQVCRWHRHKEKYRLADLTGLHFCKDREYKCPHCGEPDVCVGFEGNLITRDKRLHKCDPYKRFPQIFGVFRRDVEMAAKPADSRKGVPAGFRNLDDYSEAAAQSPDAPVAPVAQPPNNLARQSSAKEPDEALKAPESPKAFVPRGLRKLDLF